MPRIPAVVEEQADPIDGELDQCDGGISWRCPGYRPWWRNRLILLMVSGRRSYDINVSQEVDLLLH